MLLFDLDLRSVAAHSPRIQILLMPRQGSAVGHKFIEVGFCCGLDQLEIFLLLPQSLNFFHVDPGRPAAVVAYPPQKQAFCPVGILLQPAFDFLVSFSQKGIVVAESPVSYYSGAVVAHPDEVIIWKWTVFLIGTAEEVAFETSFAEDLHQAPGMSERIQVRCNLGFYSKFLPKITVSVEELPDKRLTAGHVAVRLHKPPA